MSWKKRLSLATAIVALAAMPAAAKTLEMTSVYPGSFPIVGDIGKDLGNRVSALTGGSLTFTFNEPGALVPAPRPGTRYRRARWMPRGIPPASRRA